MALQNPTTLAFPPLSAPMTDPRTGILTQQWAMWFQQMYVRIGGSTPVNPSIKTQNLSSAYALATFIDTTGALTGVVGGLIIYYRSGIGITTLIDSFNVQNTASVSITLSGWAVPFGQVPGPTNQIIQNLPIAPGVNGLISQFNGTELGSGAGIVLQASIASVLLCSMTGRILT